MYVYRSYLIREGQTSMSRIHVELVKVDNNLFKILVKLERAHGECLGTRSRRRTRRTAKRLGEL
jgi:Txe/YoeB family toxin of Txe-Axe toxin-antitoxin module